MRKWRAALASFAILGAAWPAAAEPFSLQSWQTDQGLPQNSVTAVFQGREGYLWLGTYNGLVRFDGVQFKVFDSVGYPGLKNSRVTSLHESSDRTLWIGHETGDISTFRDGTFAACALPSDWPGREIVAFGQDGAGDEWALNVDGHLLRVRDGRQLGPLQPVDASSSARASLSEQPGGELWVLFRGATGVLRNGELRPFFFEPTNAAFYTEQICRSSDGGIWVVADQLIRKWKGGGWTKTYGRYPWSNKAFITTLRENRSGALLVGTLENGLFVLEPDGTAAQVNRRSGLPHDWVRGLAEDHEGNIWVGTGGGGLCVLRDAKVTMHHPPDDWQGRGLLSITHTRSGDLWVGTEGAGLYRLRRGKWVNFAEESGLNNRFIWSVLEDSRGALWVGTWGNGLFTLHGDQFVPAPGFEPFKVQVTALFEDRDGVLWAGSGAGLLRYQDGAVKVFAASEGITALDIRTITQTADGALWFGTMGGGLGRLQEGRIQMFTRSNGLASDFILSLYADAEGALWIGTLDNGLCRFKDGAFATINSSRGLANDVIGHISEDAEGWFWFSSQAGIFRVSREELNRCLEGRKNNIESLSYGKDQGLSTLACAAGFQPSGSRTANGHLWIPTAKGLAEINPADVKKNISPPPVRIESALIGGRLHILPAPAASGPPGATPGRTLHLGPHEQRLALQFTGLSYISPDRVRFRYRLSPLENDWVEGGTRRAADYSYIPPGEYEFSVMACNNDGLWNYVGDQVRVVVHPHFWQTLWFRATAGGAVMLALGGGVFTLTRRRERRKLERLRQEAALERERTRIAQDIHDDLGASLTRITMLSHSALEETPPASPLRDALDQIYDTAREVTRIMDEIVWAVNPRHDSLDSLVNYLGRFAQTFLGAAHLRCRLELPVEIPHLPIRSEVRHNLFLAFKESLNNIARHAQASEVRVEIAFAGGELRVLIQDDGRGFKLPAGLSDGSAVEDAARRARGNGLTNLHRRLREIGGQCRIESIPGQGTRIALTTQINVTAAPRP